MIDDVKTLKAELLKRLGDQVSEQDRVRVLGYFEDLSNLAIRRQKGEDTRQEELHVKAQIAAEAGVEAEKLNQTLIFGLEKLMEIGFASLFQFLGRP